MREILPIFVVSGFLAAASVTPAWAQPACSGNACSALAMAGDGCVWVNKGDKAVRFSLIASGAARVVTVLAPGESFKESDKKYCVAGAGDAARYEASFAVLAKMPDEDRAPAVKVAKPAPRAKPATLVTAVGPATPAAATGEVALASVAPAIPLPRAKPAPPPTYPPAPRAKPEVAAVAEAAPIVPVPPVAMAQPAAAVEPATALPVAMCGSACPPILFKVIDDCLWVLNLNPRAVAFEAEAGGKRTMLALEAADGAKADAHAAALAKGQVATGEGVHMRLADPFQTAGSGIPVYRARLGSATACVKSRGEITRFTAGYVK